MSLRLVLLTNLNRPIYYYRSISEKGQQGDVRQNLGTGQNLCEIGMRNYNNDLDYARGLLGEAASILNNQKIDFVVIGGWIPYLFNSEPISHPGTFDVDVLLNSETSRQAMNEAVDAFMKVGYLRSPKNAFQISRILRVGTEDRVFHVDFLHRKYAEDVDDMIKDWGKIQSIAGRPKITARDVYGMVRNRKEPENPYFSLVAATFEKAIT